MDSYTKYDGVGRQGVKGTTPLTQIVPYTTHSISPVIHINPLDKPLLTLLITILQTTTDKQPFFLPSYAT